MAEEKYKNNTRLHFCHYIHAIQFPSLKNQLEMDNEHNMLIRFFVLATNSSRTLNGSVYAKVSLLVLHPPKERAKEWTHLILLAFTENPTHTSA